MYGCNIRIDLHKYKGKERKEGREGLQKRNMGRIERRRKNRKKRKILEESDIKTGV